MTDRSPAGPERDVEDVVEERFTAEQSPLGRVFLYVMLGVAALVGLARLTGRMDLVNANADLMAVLAGLAGLAWLPRTIRVGAIRIGRKGVFTVRRENHPVAFWALTTVYALGFVALAAAGWAHRVGLPEL